MPKISIIVPVYNTQQYLHRCIESILSQTFSDFELLLIDDGSTDRSGDICDEYEAKDKRVRVFHMENKGASAARNKGLCNVRGEWIAFVDSDDFIFESFLHNFITGISDKADLVCQGMEFNHSYSEAYPINKFGVDYYGDVKNGLLKLYQTPMPGSLCNKCFKTKIIIDNKLRLNESIILKEDEVFVLNYLKHCKFMVSLKNVGYYYFLPQWESKYKECKNRYDVAKEIYTNQLVISGYKWNSMLLNSISELTLQFSYAFINSVNKRETLMEFRECVGNNILKTNIFVLSKWLIYIDKKGYFSTFLLRIHFMLKSLIHLFQRHLNLIIV